LIALKAYLKWAPSLPGYNFWKRLKTETPHLKKLPSEYIKQHIWFTTQPMDEPERRKYLADIIEWIGWDRLIFATDYPHWDYDDPTQVLPMPLPEQQRRDFFFNNAIKLYRQT